MPFPDTLPQAVRVAAEKYGDRPAVVDGSTRLTFADLHQRVRDAARGYLALGVRPGDRVAIWAPNTWEWVVAGLAITYAGAALVPLNTRYKGHEVVDVVERTGATVLVMADGFLGRDQLAEIRAAAATLGDTGDVVAGLPALRGLVRIGSGASEGTVTFGELATVGAAVADAELDAVADAVTKDDVADILFTSGTTGRSKGVLTAHRQTIAAARVWGTNGGVSPDDNYLVISPFFHSYGYKVGLVTGILFGCTIFPVAAFDARETLRLITEERISIVPGAPTIFYSLLQLPEFAGADTSSLRFANIGAATIPVELIRSMYHELGFGLVLPAFGMTECVVATMCRPGDSEEVVATTNGRVLDGLEMRIADLETGAELGPGEQGEVQFRGDMVMLGYLDDPEATAAAIDADGWLHTGDVGSVDAEGNMRITDRIKDMYISGGFNVYPAEIEHLLLALDGVKEVAVIGVPDDRMGEVGKAFVVRTDDSTLTEELVLNHTKERLANFKVPRSVAFVDVLPRNLSGKVLKNELREDHA
ncbi:FadD3 family acyl-CoA ligase [Nocardioides daejeonensis]|uniref:FadD3 family acyl-CoA ligase n=1 Tax=Nocardioides daejeonensis TaxID=1046556 RepID=UPI000D7473BE|nr:FadD3 family acyl-CoA ligase [Nocardioides daejeonensis]